MVDGVLLPSFREAAKRRGLIEEDNTLDEGLTEATLFQMPSSLWRLFATILVFCELHDVMGLWKKHYDAMSEDYSLNHPSPDLVQQIVLIDIRNMLQSMGKDIRSFPLLDIYHLYDDTSHIPREIFEEASVEQNAEDVLLCDSLNAEQRSAYDEIMAAVCSKQGRLFFVDGPGGTGKTFLYRALLAKLCSQDKLAVATVTSGVVAAIMPGGSSRLKIPLTLQEGS
jgi:ATP-dependent DNA helicase PIF1